jgi:hypothetical protein
VGFQWSAGDAGDEAAARTQILAFLEEYCGRGMTLREAREWYADAFSLEPAAPGLECQPVLNVS